MITELLVVAAPSGAAYGVTGYVMARKGWTGLQGALWPVTVAHRVHRRRHPLPVLMDEGAVKRLEAELGVGPYSVPMIREAYMEMLRLVQSETFAHCRPPFQQAKEHYFQLMAEYFPAETPISALVWDGGRSSLNIQADSPEDVLDLFDDEPVALEKPRGRGWTRVDDRDLMRDMAKSLYEQYPVASLHGALDSILRNTSRRDPVAMDSVVSQLEWMQDVVAHSGPQGTERYASYEEATERYDELRKDLAKSFKRGDRLMKTNATERLVKWCCRHHNPRMGWYFPQPGHRDFVPWTPDGVDWTTAFGSFQ